MHDAHEEQMLDEFLAVITPFFDWAALAQEKFALCHHGIDIACLLLFIDYFNSCFRAYHVGESKAGCGTQEDSVF